MRTQKILLMMCALLVIVLLGCGGSDIDTVPSEPPPTPDTSIPPFNPPPDLPKPPTTTRPLKIYVLSVNQADSIYIEAPDGRNILIDGGQGDDVVKRLKSIGAWGKRLDLVILTHPHIDHVRGLLYVINGCPISEVWETGVEDTIFNPWYMAWRERIARLGIPIRKVKAGKFADFGGARLEVLAPLISLDGKRVSEVNNACIVTQVSYGRCKALLMADAQIEEQREILSKLSHVDLFKVPHHGVTNAALEDTYRLTTPDVSVITASIAGSLVGVPSTYTLSLVRKYCGRNYITWRDGTIVATMDGNTTSVETL